MPFECGGTLNCDCAAPFIDDVGMGACKDEMARSAVRMAHKESVMRTSMAFDAKPRAPRDRCAGGPYGWDPACLDVFEPQVHDCRKLLRPRPVNGWGDIAESVARP